MFEQFFKPFSSRIMPFGQALFTLLLLTTGLGAGLNAESTSAPAPSRASVFSPQNKAGLILPPAIYAVPGHEINVYFDNIVLVPNINNYLFDVECQKGRQDQARWRFTPTEKDVGTYDFSVSVSDGTAGLPAAQGVTKLVVVPANAGAGKKISILIIGDSLTNNSAYPKELLALNKAAGNPELKLVGSHSGSGRPPADGLAHEGYGGWTWQAFLTRWEKDDAKKDEFRARSKFLTLKEGKPVLDYQNYCAQYNGGQAPDFVTFLLGTNDVFRATGENLEEIIRKIENDSEFFIQEILKVNPATRIGVALTVPPAASQDAFGSNYGCSVTRWQFRVNQHQLVKSLIQKYGTGQFPNVSVIPTYLNLDCSNGFPVSKEPISARHQQIISRPSNGVHPAAEGYLQIADSLYYWLKYRLAEEK